MSPDEIKRRIPDEAALRRGALAVWLLVDGPDAVEDVTRAAVDAALRVDPACATETLTAAARVLLGRSDATGALILYAAAEVCASGWTAATSRGRSDIVRRVPDVQALTEGAVAMARFVAMEGAQRELADDARGKEGPRARRFLLVEAFIRLILSGPDAALPLFTAAGMVAQ